MTTALRPARTHLGLGATLADLAGRALTPLILALVIAGIAMLAAEAAPVTQRRVILMLVNVSAVIGLYIFMGNSGVLNFASVGFMAIGAYAAALTTLPPMMKRTFLPDLPPWLATLEWPALTGPFTGGAVAAAVALAVGLPIMRLSGIAAAIATFSLMIMTYVVLGNWDSLTGGQASLMGLKPYVTLWTAAAFAIGAILVAWAYQETRWALALRASREDEVAARAIGIRVSALRLGAFTLGAFVCGVAGALYGHFQGTLRVENFYLDPTFLLVTMLVVGGQRSLTGAVAGTVAISALAEGLRQLELGFALPGIGTLKTAAGFGDVVLAALMLAILIFRPNGLTGGREAGEFFRRR
jgi:branched-chain amino acid transport system permease protein